MSNKKFLLHSISKHAQTRIKERLGLSKRGQIRHINKVLADGEIIAYKEKEKKWQIFFNEMVYSFLYIDDEKLLSLRTVVYDSNCSILDGLRYRQENISSFHKHNGRVFKKAPLSYGHHI